MSTIPLYMPFLPATQELPAIFTCVTQFLSCVLCSGTSSACDFFPPFLFPGYKSHRSHIVGSSLGCCYFPAAQSLRFEALIQQTPSATYLWIRWSYTTQPHLVLGKSVNCMALSGSTEHMSKLPRWEKKREYTSTTSQKWWLRDVCSLTHNSAQKL